MATSNVVEVTRKDKALVLDTFENFAPGVMPLHADVINETWLEGTIEDQQKFVKRVAILFNAVSALRSDLDKQIWEGHDSGAVSDQILSIRAQRTGDAPGRKPTVKDDVDKLMRF